MTSEQALDLLEQIRQNYLIELPVKCDEIENLILMLQRHVEEHFDELYRRVHSMKGSAGTHGLAVVSSLCHELEERLALLSRDGSMVRESDIATMLALVDLIRRAALLAQTGQRDFSELEEELERVRRAGLPSLHRVLLVEYGYVSLLAQEALSNLPIQLVVEDDGLKALQQLLSAPFDCVISANEVKTLNGVALMSALRASDSRNKNIPAILLTSREQLQLRNDLPFNYVVSRNAHFSDELVAGVTKALGLAADAKP